MKINKEKDEDGYSVLGSLVEKWQEQFKAKNGYIPEYPYYVYYREKYDFNNEWDEGCVKVELETHYGKVSRCWEWDFYEGEDEIELVGITPEDYISEVKPLYKFKEDKNNE